MIAFYCKECKLDQDLEAYLNNGAFKAKCKRCGRKLLRYSDDKLNDPYYYESKRVRIERDRHGRALIQPGEKGFQTFYRKQWEKMEKEKELHTKNMARKKRERDEFYRTHFNERNVIKKALDIEEMLEYGGK